MTQLPASNEPITSAQAEYDLLADVSPETPCPYLPDRMSRCEAYSLEKLDSAAHEALLTRGFRRSGRVLYRPRCRHCHECRQLRVVVGRFRPTRSMRRVWRINADVRAAFGDLIPTDEKYDLFVRYLNAQHDDTMPRSRESFLEFLYDSPTETGEVCYFVGERLAGVSILDRCPRGLSSVYMYFDPDFCTRSLGTFSALWEIEHCRREKLRYYYLGFHVADSPTMAYKARFRPNEILHGEGQWVSLRE